jgi:hypothetical protein
LAPDIRNFMRVEPVPYKEARIMKNLKLLTLVALVAALSGCAVYGPPPPYYGYGPAYYGPAVGVGVRIR